MKKSDLKRMLKPLIKECVQEMILEEGLLKNIVSEVASGMQGNLVTETKQTRVREPMMETDMQERSGKARRKLNEHRKSLMDSIGKDAYGGVNVFEGLEPMKAQTETKAKAGSVDLGDPNDSGVNLDSILGNSAKIWKAMK